MIEKILKWIGIKTAQTPFATLKYMRGKSKYHRNAMNQKFKDSLAAYLECELLPQVDKPYDAIDGTVEPEYNEEKYCGPRSAVKDFYQINVAFIRKGSKDTIKAQIHWDSTTGAIRPRYKDNPLVLWTHKKQEEKIAFNSSIEDIVQSIKKGKKDDLSCPRCHSSLKLVDTPALFDLSCKSGCFNYNYHRDPKTGQFLHGHFFS